MKESEGIHHIKKALQFIEQELPKKHRCKVKSFDPDCFQCKVNIMQGWLESYLALQEWVDKNKKRLP